MICKPEELEGLEELVDISSLPKPVPSLPDECTRNYGGSRPPARAHAETLSRHDSGRHRNCVLNGVVGAAWHFIRGLKNSPQGERLIG